MTQRADFPLPPGMSGRFWRIGAGGWWISPRQITVCALLWLAMLGLATADIMAGRIDIPWPRVLALLGGQGDGGPLDRILLDIRLPRVVTALFVGAGLGASGAVFQSVSRNALGSPDIIGCTTGAATGALLQIILFNGGPLAVSVAAIVGGIVTAIAIYALSWHGGGVKGYRLILTGIGVGAVLSAVNGLLLVKGALDNATMANLWLAGSVQARTWYHALPVTIGVTVLLPVMMLAAHRLTLMEMGDDIARQLGIPVERVRLLMVAGAVMLAALATGATGPVAFIALAAPQLVTRLTGSRGVPVLSAALMGACLLLLADLIAQWMPLGLVLPVGRITGIVGGVYLLWLLSRSRQF